MTTNKIKQKLQNKNKTKEGTKVLFNLQLHGGRVLSKIEGGRSSSPNRAFVSEKEKR